MIYFDNAATTKPFKEVLEVMNKVNTDYWYNASSLYKYGQMSHNLFEQAKNTILEFTNTTASHSVIFTSGATEANNMAIYGICNLHSPLTHKKIITTSVEHPSVFNCFKDLEKKGFEVVYLPLDESGSVDLKVLEESLDNNTILVSIMWVNNIIGSINNIKEIIKLVKKYPQIKLHVDAVQGFGKIPLDFDVKQVDLMTISSHKIHGSKSCGGLVYKNNLNMNIFTQGSFQQTYKSGTIDLPSMVGFVKALQISYQEMDNTIKHVKEIKDYLIDNLKDETNLTFNLPSNSSPYILNMSIKGKYAETSLHYLESHDICVSVSSACNSKERKPEKTVLAFTHNQDLALSAIRLSFSSDNNIDEAREFVRVIKEYIHD